jgi:hypothetical protein
LPAEQTSYQQQICGLKKKRQSYGSNAEIEKTHQEHPTVINIIHPFDPSDCSRTSSPTQRVILPQAGMEDTPPVITTKNHHFFVGWYKLTIPSQGRFMDQLYGSRMMNMDGCKKDENPIIYSATLMKNNL